ncbi:hypothetical protein [Rhodococcus sp. NPDC057529]|uniref:hypothetical protein n=1 Tax=Rhodococcus sp. NPDC057529 TaxID=3346158 RepID=UPI00366BFE03
MEALAQRPRHSFDYQARMLRADRKEKATRAERTAPRAEAGFTVLDGDPGYRDDSKIHWRYIATAEDAETDPRAHITEEQVRQRPDLWGVWVRTDTMYVDEHRAGLLLLPLLIPGVPWSVPGACGPVPVHTVPATLWLAVHLGHSNASRYHSATGKDAHDRRTGGLRVPQGPTTEWINPTATSTSVRYRTGIGGWCCSWVIVVGRG